MNIQCLNHNYSTTRRLVKANANTSFINPTDIIRTQGDPIIEGGLRTKGYIKNNDTDLPLVSVLTVVYNGAKYLEETIDSVLAQTYENVEYLILDGCSTDNTLSIIKKKQDYLDYWVSCQDNGMYDALAKGFTLCNGQYICWINADDKLLPWAFETVVEYAKKNSSQWLTGIPAFWDSKGLLRLIGSYPWYPASLIRNGWFNGEALGYIQQESTFFSKKLLDSLTTDDINTFRSSKSAGDFFLWKKFAGRSKLEIIPSVLSGFRVHDNQLSADKITYTREVRALGGKILPPLINSFVKTGFRLLSLFIGGIQQQILLQKFFKERI